MNLTDRFLFDKVMEDPQAHQDALSIIFGHTVPLLTEFLHYLENTINQMVEHSTSDRIKRIHQRVQSVKSNEEIGVKYVQAWEEKYYEREEGSKFKLLELIIKKLRKDKTPDYNLEQIYNTIYKKEN